MTTPPYPYNVRNPLFGAQGAGLIDEGSYVRAAIAACEAAGGGTVFFGPGTFLLGKDGSNPWCLNISSSKVRLLGCGKATILKHYGSAASGPVDLIRITGGASTTELEGLTLDQSGLTSPGSGVCHLLNAEEASIVKALGCYFEGGVSGAGSYVKLGGVTGLDCALVWFDNCEMRDAYGPLIEMGSNTSKVWIQNCPALVNTTDEDTIVVDDVLGEGIADIKILNNRIENSTKWAIRCTSAATFERVQIQNNPRILGWVAVDGADKVQIQNNQIFVSASGVADAVVTVANGDDFQLQGNLVSRAASCTDGLCLFADHMGKFQEHRNNWVQGTEAGLVYVIDSQDVQVANSITTTTDPGTAEYDAYTFEAASVDLDNLQCTGLLISTEAGSWSRAIQVVSSGANIGVVQIVPGILRDCDVGVRLDEGGGGAGIFTERADGLMVAGGLIDATTASWQISCSGVAIHIGLNASKFGPCHIAGNGTPEGNYTKRPGSLYTQLDGAAAHLLWVKETLNTANGWIPK